MGRLTAPHRAAFGALSGAFGATKRCVLVDREIESEKIIVIGSGDQAEVVIDILNQQNKFEIIGITTQEIELKEFCGIPVIGNDSELLKMKKKI